MIGEAVSAPGALPPSRVGPYRILRRLGAGGMGVVYLGRHDITGEPAAVKLIRPEYGAAAEHRERLRREVAAARRVPRFCTAPVIAANLDADRPWIATEYIEGPTLDVALLAQPRLVGAQLEMLAVSVAAALRAIHEQGVVHRDLKPSNILLSPWGPRVIDFGIARTDDAGTRLTRTGEAIGTPAFMAPEQLRLGSLTTALDIFAWASVVTYAATGRPPFGTGRAALGGILFEQPDLADLAEPLRSLVTAAFHKEPAQRPTAAELVDRLSGVTAPMTVRVLAAATRTPAPPEPRPAQPRRRWALPSAVALTATAVTAAVMISVPRWPAADGIPAPVETVGAPVAPRLATSQAVDGTPPPFGYPIGNPFTGPSGAVRSVAFGQLDDQPIVIAASTDWDDAQVAMWNLTTRQSIGTLATDGTDLRAVAFTEVDGVPVVVTAGDHRYRSSNAGTVPIWDLATGQPIGALTTGVEPDVHSIAVGELDGAPVAVVGGSGGRVEVWNLRIGEPVGDPLTGHTDAVNAVATGHVDAVAVAVSGSDDGTLLVWNLHSGQQRGDPLTGHTDAVNAVATGHVDGVAVAVSGSDDGTLRVWNLATGQSIGEPLTGHFGVVHAVAIGELAGTPVAVSGSGPRSYGSQLEDDQTVRVWSLAPLPGGEGDPE